MNAAKQAMWLFIALFSLACSGWYFASSAPEHKLDEQTLSSTADMVVNHLKVVQFDSKGQLTNSLQTPLMRHVPLNNTHWLQTPHIVITEENQPAWNIHAEQATALHGGQEITFQHKVVIHQEKGAHTDESTLTTEAMTYFPKDKRATTTLDVLYQRPGSTIQSTGMTAYLAEKRVQLLSDAKGTYEPKRG